MSDVGPLDARAESGTVNVALNVMSGMSWDLWTSRRAQLELSSGEPSSIANTHSIKPPSVVKTSIPLVVDMQVLTPVNHFSEIGFVICRVTLKV
jgi:hypothetical protein